MRLLLVAPAWPPRSLWGKVVFRFPYLSLTTLAALTGDEWDIHLTDENVEPVDFDNPPDLVGISVMTPLAPRAYEIADRFRARGVPVVLGGIHPTWMEEEAGRHADAVVSGEAEALWPRLLEDFRRGRLKPRYRAEAFVSMARFPIPRRDLLQRKAYFFTRTIQTSRGCPFDCQFCSVTAFYGRTYRVRPVDEVVEEIGQMGSGFVFFVDDNIVGRPGYAKELFRALTPLGVKWFSQASLSMVKDPELLDLARQSGCKGLFIGFESLSQEMLRSMGKSVNRVAEYRDAVKRLHDHGIGIQGSFIFGTDEDDEGVFSDTLRFIEAVRLEAAIFSILTPFPGTRIREALLDEGRVLEAEWDRYDMNHVVFQPRKMTPEALQEGFNWAYRRLYGVRSITKRLFPFTRNALFYGIQNWGFRRAWKQTLRSSV